MNNLIKGFHFHIYFDVDYDTLDESIALWYDIKKTFTDDRLVYRGGMQQYLTGPHTKPQFVLEVAPFYFGEVFKFLMLNRDNLSVLIHPLMDNEMEAHTHMAVWMGKEVPLDLSKL